MKEFIAQRCIHIILIFGERVKTRVRFTAYLNWKRDICCATAYPSSVWKNCLLCTIKYASSAKKVTHYVTSRLRIKGMNNTWARLHRKTTIHMIIVCVKVQILLFVVSEHIQWNCYILSKRGNFLWLCYLQKLAISIELVSNIIIVCLLFLAQKY